MDFKAFTQSDTFELVIDDPITGKDTGAKIVLYGSDSKHYRAVLSSLKEEGTENRGVELLAGITKSWENIEFDGKGLDCNKANATMIYKEVPFITAKVEKVVFDRVNFMQSLGKKP